MMAFTATLQTDQAYTWVFRFVVTPLFLLSGTFFPIDSLPAWATYIANATPLYHGIELVRALTTGTVTAFQLVNVAYLAALRPPGADATPAPVHDHGRRSPPAGAPSQRH